MSSFNVHLASPTSFPFDPRYEQMSTAKVLPAGRVFSHRHKRDQSRLLSLPDEILWQITQLVAVAEKGRFLSALALVNSECRQLARPWQFADMFVTRSDKCWGFIRHLLQEVKQEQEQGQESQPPSLGACIRSLSITVDNELCSGYGCPTDKEYRQWRKKWQLFVDDLAEAVESSMPNLERVYWRDTAELEVQHLLRAVLQHCYSDSSSSSSSSSSSYSASKRGRMHELAFAGYGFLLEEVDHVTRVKPPDAMKGLRLRSLAFGEDKHCGDISHVDGCMPYLAESILRRSAPTLEEIVWNASLRATMGNEDHDVKLAFLDGPIEFPKLKKFWAGIDDHVGFQPSVLESFLAAPLLESFAPSALLSSMIIDHNFVDKFPLPRLHTFAIAAVDMDIPDSELIDYVEQVFRLARLYATQIEELFIYPQPSVDQLVSHLSGNNSFCNLRSLCFSWVEDPELRILKTIGSSLVTLEELSFVFQPRKDMAAGWQDVTWVKPNPLSHGDIIAAIRPLQNLIRLSVLGDEYIAHWCDGRDWSIHRFYRELVWFNQGRAFSSPRVDDFGHERCYARGERGHRWPGDSQCDWMTPWLTNRADDPRSAMVEVAEKYGMAFPRLRGFVCGRVMLEITGR